MFGGLIPRPARHAAARAPHWPRTLLRAGALGAGAGVLWFLTAPGGGLYGSGTDFAQWPLRDLILAGWCALAGLLSGVLLLRRAARHDGPDLGRFLWAIAAALLGSVVAWRCGVFAGDVFQTPPDPLSNPSMIFSLRSGPVLLVWPLVLALTVTLASIASGLRGHPAPGEVKPVPPVSAGGDSR